MSEAMNDLAAEDSAIQVEGWDELAEGIRTLPRRMIERLPAQMLEDPQVRQEVGRLALEALACSVLDALASDEKHPVFVTQIGHVLNVGQPNADTVYRMARIAPEGTYRLRGRSGSLRMFDVSQAPPSPGEPGFSAERGSRPNHDCTKLGVDDQGRFDVVLSPERPAGHLGDWWRLEPTTTKLLLRMVSADWTAEEDPSIAIERVDLPVRRPRRPAAELHAALSRLPEQIDFIGMLFVGHVARLQQEGFVNALKVYDLSTMGGLATQFYYEGIYEITDDEALIVEVAAPAKCRYRSLILTNELYETIDWINNHSSLNDAQAPVDPDGILRIVVSSRDPGVPNWLDTAGHPRGVIQGRWAECDPAPVPSVRKVAFAAISAELPAGTPRIAAPERERLVRERRSAFLQRPLW